MDLGGMRSWMKQQGLNYIITERVYHTILEEKETDVVELRLVMLRGDMDYTAACIEPKADVEADRASAIQRMKARLQWETQRDTGVVIDCEQGMEHGQNYQSNAAKR